MIVCNLEVFWLLQSELLLPCADQKGQTLPLVHVFLSFLACTCFFPSQPSFKKLNTSLNTRECSCCGSGAISWHKIRIARNEAGCGTAGSELDSQPAPAMSHCLPVFLWDYFCLSLMLQKMNQDCDSWCSYFSGLFNLRGSDVEYNPVFFAYAVIGMNTIRCLYSLPQDAFFPFIPFPKMHFSGGEPF